MEMARSNLSSMSVEALLKLRDDVGRVLSQKATQLEEQLSKLGAEVDSGRRGRGSAMKGRKVPVKYRDKEGNTWAGRGAQPVWLRKKLKAGSKLEDSAVEKIAAARRVPRRKTKKGPTQEVMRLSQSFPEESEEAATQEVTVPLALATLVARSIASIMPSHRRVDAR
jgi:hypothetical protein